MRQPSKLRYVECDLPDDVEKTLIAFQDDFDATLKPFYDRLKDLTDNEIPLLNSELDSQIALRNELLKGSPVNSLSSLAALDQSTGLTDPSRDNNDPNTIRLDERKLGAAGICLLNGRMFKILQGNRLEALRHLWEMSRGEYDYFVRLGTAVYSTASGTYTLYEQNSFTPENLPYVNKGFTYLESIGQKNSQFRHRMIWASSITSSYVLKTKMVDLGYESEQINNIFSGLQPNANYDYIASLQSILTLIQAVTRLVFLPKSDPIRQPAWHNEANYIELAIKRFLTYRTKKYTTSSIFDKDYWAVFLTELRPADIKELLENRPEVKDIELPQNMESITALIEKAIAIPAETTIINTWMNGLPKGIESETKFTHTLYDLGLAIYKQLKAIGELTRAAALEALLLELIGSKVLVGYFYPPILIDPADLSALFPTATLPPLGELLSAIGSTQDQEVVKSSLGANSGTRQYTADEQTTIQKENLDTENGSTTNNVPSGSVQGFPSEETFAMILTRRIKWNSNFTDCSGETTIGKSTATFPQQQMETVAEYTKEASVESNAEWAKHQDNMAYIKEQLSKQAPAINLSGKTIADIRSAMTIFIDRNEASGHLTLKDTHVAALWSDINSSKDIKVVASKSIDIIKMTPVTTADISKTTTLASDLTGDERGAGLYAAKNRNFIEQQGGQISPPPDQNGATAGLTQGEVRTELERAIGSKVSWFGQGESANDILVPFRASTNVELQFCQNKAFKDFDNYLKGLLKPPGWLIRSINIIKQQLLDMQDKIDRWIVAAQTAMDAVLAKLERLLTIDLNFSGKLGFDNSLFKCSWGIDLGLKINLLDLLLMYLDRLLGLFLGPLLKLLSLLGDFINEVLCIPIRWLGQILNGAAFAAAELLAKIGCTVKDFQLPLEIFDLLNLINGLFSLRSLVFRKGSADWLNMMNRIKLGKNEFTGLSQFASMCAKDNLSASLAALSSEMRRMSSGVQVSAVDKGVDGAGTAVSNMA